MLLAREPNDPSKRPLGAQIGIRPTTRLFAARALRDFGDGFVAILLPAYLLELGHGPLTVGVLSTASLLGSALLTVGVGLIGAHHDPRRLLLAAAGLMTATGLAFAFIDDYALLLLVAFAGTINASAGTVSVFVPLEHSVLAREVRDAERTRMFARYSLVGALAAAVGALAAGAPAMADELGTDRLAIIQAMFVLYALVGIAGGLLYAGIPSAPPPSTGPASALGPSRGIVIRLAALFSLDAFAGGFVVQSLLALWLFERFGMSLPAAEPFRPVGHRIPKPVGFAGTRHLLPHGYWDCGPPEPDRRLAGSSNFSRGNLQRDLIGRFSHTRVILCGNSAASSFRSTPPYCTLCSASRFPTRKRICVGSQWICRSNSRLPIRI